MNRFQNGRKEVTKAPPHPILWVRRKRDTSYWESAALRGPPNTGAAGQEKARLCTSRRTRALRVKKKRGFARAAERGRCGSRKSAALRGPPNAGAAGQGKARLCAGRRTRGRCGSRESAALHKPPNAGAAGQGKAQLCTSRRTRALRVIGTARRRGRRRTRPVAGGRRACRFRRCCRRGRRG